MSSLTNAAVLLIVFHQDLAKRGYSNQLCIDFSSVVVQLMSAKVDAGQSIPYLGPGTVLMWWQHQAAYSGDRRTFEISQMCQTVV